VRTDDLDYELPEELVAQRPLEQRDAARLLVVGGAGEGLGHQSVKALPDLLPPCLVVLNDTRVINARLLGHKPTGGRVELLLLERLSEAGVTERWKAMGRASKKLSPGTRVHFGDGALVATVEVKEPSGLLEVRLEAQAGVADVADVAEAMERLGTVPLPPYVRRTADAADLERYQTVFAERPGAVAAPTAGLHLSEPLLARFEARGFRFARVTLHVGLGTFAPVKAERLEDHPMHEERYEVPEATAVAIAEARASHLPVLAVGTTVVRTLEAVALEHGVVEPGAGRTSLFVRPGFSFRVVDHLLTNFHLPRSTLLALVMAFAGEDAVRAAYEEAVRARYRFFSYGDAMLLSRHPAGRS
jgi:S-adenosylmethionine:tRNA ribosyltransferase-isomerase